MKTSAARVLSGILLASSLATLGCGEKKPPESAQNGEEDGGAEGTATPTTDKPAPGEADAKTSGGKKEDCTSFDIENLDEPLNKVVCEVPNLSGGEASKDMKDKLEVKVTPFPSRVAPGGTVSLIVTFVNKSKDPLPLNFQIDPTPRFEIEVYDTKNKRADQPAGKPPSVKNAPPRPPTPDAKTARVTIAPSGTAKMKLSWTAAKMIWAPERLAGSLERGFPRKAAGPLSKGKYNLRVLTPLIGVSEGIDKEVSAPRVQVEVGG